MKGSSMKQLCKLHEPSELPPLESHEIEDAAVASDALITADRFQPETLARSDVFVHLYERRIQQRSILPKHS
jgi:hypothetical protein